MIIIKVKVVLKCHTFKYFKFIIQLNDGIYEDKTNKVKDLSVKHFDW